jgi:uncharacterized phage infection (PIP) family protein YhgE
MPAASNEIIAQAEVANLSKPCANRVAGWVNSRYTPRPTWISTTLSANPDGLAKTGEGTVLPKRGGQESDESTERTTEMAAYETARSATESSSKPEEKKGEEHISLFWRVFGGTILSIVALVSITVFNNMSSSITELRNELSREREARAELVKKEEFNTRVTAQYERLRGIETVKVELEGLKEKVNSNATAMDGVKRETAALKKETATLEVLKEKVTTAAADLKTIRDDLAKLSAEVEKNKTSDLERKTLRDGQVKQLEESLKELQKMVQDCREKLARLEGAQPKPLISPPSDAKPEFVGPPKPVNPSETKPGTGIVEPGSSKPAGK